MEPGCSGSSAALAPAVGPPPSVSGMGAPRPEGLVPWRDSAETPPGGQLTPLSPEHPALDTPWDLPSPGLPSSPPPTTTLPGNSLTPAALWCRGLAVGLSARLRPLPALHAAEAPGQCGQLPPLPSPMSCSLGGRPPSLTQTPWRTEGASSLNPPLGCKRAPGVR